MALRGERPGETLRQHIDARIGAVRIAEFMNAVCNALKQR